MKFKLLFLLICLGFVGSIYSMDETPDEMLIRGAREGDINVVRQAIESKANVNAQDRYGHTALMDAADRGYHQIVRLLLNKEANPNIQNKYGSTALFNAIRSEKKYIVRILLEEGASLEEDKDESALKMAEGLNFIIQLIKTEREKRIKLREQVQKEIAESGHLLPDLAGLVSEYAVYPKKEKIVL